MKGPDPFTFSLVLLLAGVGLVLLGIVSAGRTVAAPVAATPEEAVEQVLFATHRGQYGQAALFFEGGKQIWRHSPTWARQYIDQITDQGRAEFYEIRAEGTSREVQLLLITTYTDHELTNPLRTATWHFAPAGGGWVIRKVE